MPATKEARSREITLLLNSTLETFLWVILSARPSAIADLPTPGSPINSGLFFFLLERIWETLSISFSLPTIGSNLSSSANLVKSRPKLSKTGVLDLLSVVFLGPLLEKLSSFSISSSSADSGYLDSGRDSGL